MLNDPKYTGLDLMKWYNAARAIDGQPALNPDDKPQSIDDMLDFAIGLRKEKALSDLHTKLVGIYRGEQQRMREMPPSGSLIALPFETATKAGEAMRRGTTKLWEIMGPHRVTKIQWELANAPWSYQSLDQILENREAREARGRTGWRGLNLPSRGGHPGLGRQLTTSVIIGTSPNTGHRYSGLANLPRCVPAIRDGVVDLAFRAYQITGKPTLVTETKVDRHGVHALNTKHLRGEAADISYLFVRDLAAALGSTGKAFSWIIDNLPTGLVAFVESPVDDDFLRAARRAGLPTRICGTGQHISLETS